MIALLQDKVSWADQTNVHPVGLAVTLLLSFGILVFPRRMVPGALLAHACLIPTGQRVALISLDFTFLRILMIVGWIRVIARGEWRVAFRPMDILIIVWAVTQVAVYTILHGTTSAFVFKAGDAFDVVSTYFLIRTLVRGWSDIEDLSTWFFFLSLLVCAAFIVEGLTARNLFSAFGGVPVFTETRGDRLRCQGAFPHSILAGCFWASSMPLLAARWWARGTGKLQAVLGTACAALMIALTTSSTPILSAGAALLGGLAFLGRRYLKVSRYAVLAGAVTVHLLMRQPIWHLLGRVSVIGGSTGWYRYYLVDETIKRFPEWWLLGAVSTSAWGPGLGDVTCQYVIEAVQGGLLRLVLFVGILVCGFGTVSRLVRAAGSDRFRLALSWALGVSLFAQCTAFIGVAYFGQAWILLFLVLACLTSLDSLPRTGSCQRF